MELPPPKSGGVVERGPDQIRNYGPPLALLLLLYMYFISVSQWFFGLALTALLTVQLFCASVCCIAQCLQFCLSGH